jgi:hypothetical protein
MHNSITYSNQYLGTKAVSKALGTANTLLINATTSQFGFLSQAAKSVSILD